MLHWYHVRRLSCSIAIMNSADSKHETVKTAAAVAAATNTLFIQDEGEALKIVHYFWDDAEVAFVTISNTPLDAAKTNRAAVVFRSEPTSEDLSRLAYSFFKANTVQDCSAFMQHCIQACCQAYSVLVSRGGTGEKRHLRDFHHFLKYFSRRCRCASAPLQFRTQGCCADTSALRFAVFSAVHSCIVHCSICIAVKICVEAGLPFLAAAHQCIFSNYCMQVSCCLYLECAMGVYISD